MDKIPKELEETQLHLQVVVDPETKCITMKTHTEDIPSSFDIKPTEIIPNDPLYHPEIGETDLEKMTELEKLIYTERQRLLNLKVPKKSETVKKRKDKDSTYYADLFETDSYNELTQNEKSKLRMRKFRERESSEERDYRRFRHRIITMKNRLMQKLRNFENESYLREKTKRNTDRIKQKRLELKANETPEQRALRKSLINSKSRLAKIRRKAFRTPEEMLADKEKRLQYLQNFWSKHTAEQRQAHQIAAKEKAKERRRKNIKEWKKVEMKVKGESMVEIPLKSVVVEKV